MKIKRSGYLLIELTISILVVSMLLVVVAQLIAAASVRIQGSQQRMFAIESAANLLERVTSFEYGKISHAIDQEPSIAEFIQSSLANWDVKIDVTDDNAKTAKQIVVSLAPRHDNQTTRGVIQLVAWKYAAQ